MSILAADDTQEVIVGLPSSLESRSGDDTPAKA